MAEVGILNLTIQDNSEQAAQGLDNLAGALGRVKEAVDGVRLTGVANQIKKLAEVIDEKISGSTIAKLSDLGDALSKLKGLGDIKINIRDSGASAKIKDTVVDSVETAEELARKFYEVNENISRANESLDGFNSSLQTALSIMQDKSWQSGYEQFKEMFAEWSKIRSMFSLGPGQDTELSTKRSTAFRYLTDGAIECEYTISDAAENITDCIGEIGNKALETGSNVSGYLTGVSEQAEETAEEVRDAFSDSIPDAVKRMAAEADRIRKQQEDAFYAKRTYSMDETNAMADNLTQLDLLKAKLREAEIAYNKLMNTLGANNTKTIKAGLAVSKIKDEIWSYINDLKSSQKEASKAKDVIQDLNSSMSGFKNVDDLVGASKADLMSMKYAGMKDALQQDIDAGKLDQQQIAERIMRLQDLQDKIEQLSGAEEEAANSTRSFGSAWESFKTGVKAMFPTLTGLIKKFGQIAKYRALRAVLKYITQGFTEGIKNVYQYSNAIGSSFASSMDSASASLLQMKNSVGAAVAPAIQALIPILQTVVSWVITAVNYLNQLFALLNGQKTWTRALNTTSKAFDNQKKAAQGAGAAIKDLLADWDELNIIQSQSGGGGGGAADAAEDYLKMFEEVSEFDKKIKGVVDFLKENLDKVKTIAKEIGAAILGWKVSEAFAGFLSSFASIVTAGILFKLSYDITGLLDEAYKESGDNIVLIADAVINGAIAMLADKLVGATNEGAGKIAAGLVLAVSAGTSFAVAEGIEDESKKKMLDLLAAIKAGVGAALVSAGFMALGLGVLPSIVFGTITVGLTAYITYTVKLNAQAMEEAKTFAKNAFAETGEGGIKAKDYVEALKAEFDNQTAGTELVLRAYVDVPMLKGNLADAASKIQSFNSIIFNGEGKITEADAAEFQRAWGMVIETLDNLNTKTYQTILEGLTEALSTKNAELREQVEYTRTTFIMLEKNVSEENAKIYKDMEDLVAKISKGDFTDADLEEYGKLYKIVSAATETGMEEINKALEEGAKIDFGNAEEAVDNALEFVNTVGEAAVDAMKEVDDAVAAQEAALNMKRRVEKAKAEGGYITQDQYEERMAAYDEIADVILKRANEKKEAIESAMQQAFDIVFKQAVSIPEAQNDAYWSTVIVPLMEAAKKAGYDYPQELYDAFAEGATSAVLTDYGTLDPNTFIESLMENGILNVDDVAKKLNEEIEGQFGEQQTGIVGFIVDALSAGNNIGLTEAQASARDLMDLSGWDYLTENWKDWFIKKFKDNKAFGPKFTRELLETLGETQEYIREKLGAVDEEDWEMDETYIVHNDIQTDNSAIEAAEKENFGIPESYTAATEVSVDPVFDESAISEGAKAFLHEMREAIASGDQSKITETMLSGLEKYGSDAYMEVQQEIQDTVNRTKDTVVEDTEIMSSQKIGDIDISAFMNSLNSMYIGTTNYVNAILAQMSRLNSFMGFSGGAGASFNSKNKYTSIEMRASGGAVKSGDLVMANENGEFEMMGQMGNQPIVANNNQIIAGITAGVQNAQSEQNALLRRQNDLLTQLLQKKMVAEVKPTSTLGRANARSAAMYDRVTG